MDGADVPLVSVDPVLDGKLYIGNLAAGLSKDLHAQLNITHILSVCPENPSTNADAQNHLCIPVQDSELDDLLIHLPNACQFIQSALDTHGVVLVHCLMGVSRSAAVACAYLMQLQRIDARAALQLVRKHRPNVHPNYGFRKQLHAFADCRYKPSENHPDYIAWKRRQKRDVTKYLNTISDTVPVVLDQLYLTSDFPKDADAAESFLLDTGTTHILSISSAQQPMPQLASTFTHCFIDVPNNAREALLLELPTACKFTNDALAGGGQVLVQCRVELRACIVVCAYLMSTRKISVPEALSILQKNMALFDPSPNFFRHLDLFAACGYHPTTKHPLVQAWIAEGKVPLKPHVHSGSPTRGKKRLITECAFAQSTPMDMSALGDALKGY